MVIRAFCEKDAVANIWFFMLDVDNAVITIADKHECIPSLGVCHFLAVGINQPPKTLIVNIVIEHEHDMRTGRF